MAAAAAKMNPNRGKNQSWSIAHKVFDRWDPPHLFHVGDELLQLPYPLADPRPPHLQAGDDFQLRNRRKWIACHATPRHATPWRARGGERCARV